MFQAKYVVITPAQNEEALLQNTIDSLTRQTRLPARWIIVDDGSTDQTLTISEAAANQYPWIRVVRRGGVSERRVGSATATAVQLALPLLSDIQYEFLCVLDADLMLGTRYYEVLLNSFDQDTSLGIASGLILDREANGQVAPMRERSEMTAGAIKCWRRSCFEDIGGLVNSPCWDAVDCYKAMMLGWKTRTFRDPELRVTHLRPTGSSHKSIYEGRMRRGRSMYVMGSLLLWTLASAAYHSVDSPYLIGSFCMLAGYVSAMLRRLPRIDDPELIHYIRRNQWHKITQIVLRRGDCEPLRYYSRGRLAP